MNKESINKLGTVIGRDNYLFELARQSGCKHDGRILHGTCTQCGKMLEKVAVHAQERSDELRDSMREDGVGGY